MPNMQQIFYISPFLACFFIFVVFIFWEKTSKVEDDPSAGAFMRGKEVDDLKSQTPSVTAVPGVEA